MEELSCLKIDGYHLVASYTRSVGTHGGCCVFAIDDLKNKVELYDLKHYSEDFDVECSCAVDRINKVVIVVVYRSPVGAIDKFFEQIKKVLENIEKKFSRYKHIICGDFNICLLKHDKTATSFKDILIQHNFTQTITDPTRVTKNSASLIDNIFVNYDNSLKGNIVNTALSDHYAQTIGLHLDNASVVPKKTYAPVFSKGKLEQFAHEVSLFSWEDVYRAETDSGEGYEVFVSKILDLMKVVFVPKCTRIHTKDHSWITCGIRISCKNKRKLYISRNKGLITNEFYKKYCDVLKRVINLSKKMKNENYLRNSQNKGKAMWSLIDQYTGKPRKEHSILENMANTDDNIASATLTLNKVNEHFINICPKLTNKETQVKVNQNRKSLFLYPATEGEVHCIIKSLRNTSSVGDDGIPVKLIKSIAPHIAEPLTFIINKSFETGNFPQQLKCARVKAIFKKGEKDDIGNYRPIAILNSFSKVYEKIIANRLTDFLEKEKILNGNQNGFRKGKSTIRSVYMALIEILHSINNGKNTVAVCLDLSKAFDSVEHDTLLKKLESYGIRGIALRLIASYLTDRIQYVAEKMANGNLIKSEILKIKRGVPQGSILGPLLYIIYTNELPQVLPERILQFADDTSVIISCKEGGQFLKEKIANAINTLQRWFHENNLTLNLDKTQILNFSFHETKYRLCIPYYNDTYIDSNNTIYFLGIGLDSRLDWTYHIDSLLSKTGKYAYALRMMNVLINRQTALTAYYAHVHSRLSYGIIFWGRSSDFIRVFRLQKRCVRNVLGLRFTDSCKEYFIQMGILTLPCMYIYECILFVKKNMDLFISCSHLYDTRSRENLVCNKYNYSYLQKNVEHMTIKIFNTVPAAIRNLPVSKMKYVIRKILSYKAYYTIEEFLQDSDFNL